MSRARRNTQNNRFGTKVEYLGNQFDSNEEKLYYIHLLQDPEIDRIKLQPEYTILERYSIECVRCKTTGRILNESTGNMNKCRLCEGTGHRSKQGAIYTADFLVTYNDGYQETIDVKGFVQRDFPLRRRMFESITGKELVVVRKKGNTWIRE